MKFADYKDYNPHVALCDNIPEIWKDVIGYENYYEVSNYGNVRSKKRFANYRNYGGKQLKPSNRGNGYLCVDLSVNCESRIFSVHVIVAKAFLPNPTNLPQVNHINGIKADNRLENLEWSDASAQAIHAYQLGLRSQTKGADDPRSKGSYQYDMDGNFIKFWGSLTEAKRGGYAPCHISSNCLGKTKSYRGYVWSFKKLHQ
jgi:hypothetical protein